MITRKWFANRFFHAFGISAVIVLLSVLVQGCYRQADVASGASVPNGIVDADGCRPPEDVVTDHDAKYVEESDEPAQCKAAILVYHHINAHTRGEPANLRAMTVSPDALDGQLRYLRDHGYSVVPFGSVVDCLTKGEPLPDKAVVITIDDGWEGPYVHALPLLQKYGVTATFFVVTNMVGDGKILLSWAQVKDLDAKGMTIGSHTKTHPYLTHVWDQVRLKDEIAGSKKVLEDRLGKPVPYFAYPYGAVDARVAQAAKAAGYVAARGTYDGTHHRPSDLFNLHAVYVTDDIDRFARDISR